MAEAGGSLKQVKDSVPSTAASGLSSAEAEAMIEATLRGGSLGLVEVARNARLSENEKLLVVVDQFEELFRFRAARAATSADDEAAAFVKRLLEAAHQRDFSLYVVLTMRSDFLGDCAQFQGLPEAINDGQYLIPRMTRDERRMAITGPVGVTRGKMAEPLINRLLNDVGDNPDQLPILQHALMRPGTTGPGTGKTVNRLVSIITRPSARWKERSLFMLTRPGGSCLTNAAGKSPKVFSEV
jgi:hypothetical protein